MKLGEARQATSDRLHVLFQKKQELTKLLNGEQPTNTSGTHFDRVELSKALSDIETEYDQTQDLAEQLSALDTNLQNAESTRQQNEAIAEAAEELMKILEVFRRISKGDRVPATDEKKLMEYSPEMYMAAKNMALLNQRCEGKKHKSLWEEDATKEDPVDPSEFAAHTEVGNPLPKVSACVEAAESLTREA